MPSYTTSHSMQIGHRLFLQPGKCQNIHGHSMKVHLTLWGNIDDNGIFEGRDFGQIKKTFREHLDSKYDHKLLLNKDDPYARPIAFIQDNVGDMIEEPKTLPGLVACNGDPTTENIARWIANWASYAFQLDCDVTVDETDSNSIAVGGHAQG